MELCEAHGSALSTVAILIDRLAAVRARAIERNPDYEGPTSSGMRRFQAEEASRTLLVALICPPEIRSPGAEIKGLLDTLQQLIWASTSQHEPSLQITTYFRHFDISREQFCWLRDVIINLVIQAYDDSAIDISVTLGSQAMRLELCCQIQHPAFGSNFDKDIFRASRLQVERVQGQFSSTAISGDSWQIEISVPLHTSHLEVGVP